MEARSPDSDSLEHPIHPQQGALANVESSMANPPSLITDINSNSEPSDHQLLERNHLQSDDSTSESSNANPMKPLSALQRIHLRLQTSSCRIKDFVSDKADRLKNAFSP